MTDPIEQLRQQAQPLGAVVAPDKFHPLYLSRLGFRISTLLDVGVAEGTPELYTTYPEAQIVLFEPRDISGVVAEYQKALPGLEYVPVALGAEEGSLALQVAPGHGALASAYRRTALADRGVDWQTVEVPVRRLDDVVAEAGWRGPFGLKVDTEGHELAVLQGAVATLVDTRFVIVEASVKRRFEGSYAFPELVAFLHEQGFELLDVLNGHRPAPRFFDCLFVRSTDRRLSLDLEDYAGVDER